MNTQNVIAQQIFSEIQKKVPDAKRKEIYSGLVVASIYQKLTDSTICGSEEKVDYYFDEVQTDYLYEKQVMEYSVSGVGSLTINNIDHRTSTREISCYFHNLSIRGDLSEMDRLKLIVHSRDLNCEQIGISFDENGHAFMYKSPDYDRFLKTGKILMSSFHSFLSSLSKAEKCASNMKNATFDKEPYLDLLIDRDEALFLTDHCHDELGEKELNDEEILKAYQDEKYQEHSFIVFADESDYSDLWDYIQETGIYSHWLESLILKKKDYQAFFYNELPRKIAMQERGFDYGISLKEMQFFKKMRAFGLDDQFYDDLDYIVNRYKSFKDFYQVLNWWSDAYFSFLDKKKTPWAFVEYLYERRFKSDYLDRVKHFLSPGFITADMHYFFKLPAEEIGRLHRAWNLVFSMKMEAFEKSMSEFYEIIKYIDFKRRTED